MERKSFLYSGNGMGNSAVVRDFGVYSKGGFGVKLQALLAIWCNFLIEQNRCKYTGVLNVLYFF